MSEKHDPFKAFESLVEKLVDVPIAALDSTELKIGLLERLIERWRIDRHKLENTVTFEEFSYTHWQMDDGGIHFTSNPSKQPDAGTGIPKIRFQRTLLVYLLLHHQRGETQIPVFDIIRKFIEEVSDHLSPVDFKKTATGVIRCFTNTRFAANKLREYGLLKYTRTEAFKTWTLSLPGIICAARALQQPDWKIPVIEKYSSMFINLRSEIDPFILLSSLSVQDYPSLVAELSAICRPNVKVFETFDDVLKKSQKLLKDYWANLNDSELTQKERGKRSLTYSQALEALPLFDEFIEELVDSIEIEKLLKTATANAKQA